MNVAYAADRCGIKILVFLVCYLLTGLGDPPASLHILAAVSASLCAAGALGALFPVCSADSGVKRVGFRSMARAALTRKNAGKFAGAASVLIVFAVVIPACGWYFFPAAVLGALAVVCLARR